MSRIEGTMPFTDVRDSNGLRELGLNTIGCVIIVVNQNGKAFVVDEISKGCGLNFIAETRKEKENYWDNVRGGLVEEMGVRDTDFDKFWYVAGTSYLGRIEFPKPDLKVHADVVMVLYTGEEQQFVSRNEVTPIGFYSLEDLMIDGSRVRQSLMPTLKALGESNAIDHLLTDATKGVLIRLFHNGQSSEQIFAQRMSKKDLMIPKGS